MIYSMYRYIYVSNMYFYLSIIYIYHSLIYILLLGQLYEQEHGYLGIT